MLIAPAPRDDEAPPFEERRYSERYSCPYDGFTIDELEPRQFSFNSPHGACPACTGPRHAAGDRPGPRHPGPLEEPRARRARAVGADADRRARGGSRSSRRSAPSHGWDFNAPVRDLPPEAIDYLLYAPEGREGRRPLPARARREHATRRPSRASSPTSSGATARPTRSTSRPSSRSSWSPGRARPAAASGCGRRSSRSPSTSATSGTSRRCRSPTRCDWATGLASDPDRARADDRPPGAQGDRRAARVPRRRRARLPDPRPDERRRCPAARRSGSGWRPRSGRR